MMESLRLFKPRKAHKKSRSGCKTCRRRKIKCDEARPACRNCVYRDEQCEYRQITLLKQSPGVANQAYTRNTRPKRLAVGQSHLAPVSPTRTSLSGGNPSAHTDTPEPPLASHESSSKTFDTDHSHLALFDHYLRHTCHASGLSSSYAYARRIGLPMLASKSKGVLYSIFAMGAACLCVDFLLGPDPLLVMDHLLRLIKAGDFYHGKALAIIQVQLDASTPEELDIAHAHAAMLMGYAPARRRIFRLLQRQQPRPALVEQEPGADAPNNLDWALLLRGMKTVARARETTSFQAGDGNAPTDVSGADSPDVILSAYVAQAVELEREQVTRLSPCTKSRATQRGAMTDVISSTVPNALNTLYEQIHVLELKVRHEHISDIRLMSQVGTDANTPLSSALLACYSTFAALEDTAHSIFGVPSSDRSRPPFPGSPHGEASGGLSKEWFSLKESRWLHASDTRPANYDPSDRVTRSLFTWIGHLPKECFYILVTHYPERSDNIELTIEQQLSALVWDIYAHWLVFTFLLEDELWWWADLGRSDIQKLRDTLPKSNEHGYSVEVGTRNWWPSQMLSLAKDLRIGKDRAPQGAEI